MHTGPFPAEFNIDACLHYYAIYIFHPLFSFKFARHDPLFPLFFLFSKGQTFSPLLVQNVVNFSRVNMEISRAKAIIVARIPTKDKLVALEEEGDSNNSRYAANNGRLGMATFGGKSRDTHLKQRIKESHC